MPATLVSIHGTDFGLDSARNPLSKERPIGKLIFANQAAASVITNTAVETAFDIKATIKANTLFPGSMVKIRFQGIAPSTNATDTLLIKLYYGSITGTLLWSSNAPDVADNNVFMGNFDIIIRTIGAAGTMVGWGTGKGNPAAPGTFATKDQSLASTAVDTTVDKDIVVSATWSVANAANQVRLDFLSVEQW